jgi:hypothetical protein
MRDAPEVWEVSYDPKAADIPQGVIHDFRFREGAFLPGFLNPRRTALDEAMDDFFFTRDYSELVGAAREGRRGQVVHLDVRRAIASVELPGLPHLASGITWTWQGRQVKTVRQIPTLGPGFFLRSHENTRYAWVDSMMSREHRDTLQVIDKHTLEVVARLRPEPGKTLAHVEFDRHGRTVLASLWEQEGALIAFDAVTLKEIGRIPMRKPVGKYNVYNKITRSEGTSH